MSKFAAGGISSAGSTTLPIGALVGATTTMPRIREIGVFNTATTAVSLRLVRLSTAGTPGTALARTPLNAADPAAAIVTAFNTYSVAPTIAADLGFRTTLGASAGSGMVWSFDDWELTIPATASAGLAIIPDTGTGQACEFYFKWTE